MKLFVYGTLMTGMPNHYLIDDYIMDVKSVVLPGYRMYSAGDYPLIAKGNPDQMVHGELVTFHPCSDEQEILGILDRLEDYSPGRTGMDNLYIRHAITINGEENVWIYIWNRTTDGLAHIPDGDWRHFCTRT